MEYTNAQAQKIFQKLLFKVKHEWDKAVEHNTINELVEKYGITLEEDVMPVNKIKSKILVFGATVGKYKDYIKAAKNLGISEYNLEFVDDYKDIKSFNATKLEYSMEYSDIIFGPTPHKLKDMGDTSSLLAKMKQESNKYPRVIVASANDSLKLSISSFKDALTKTRYFEILS